MRLFPWILFLFPLSARAADSDGDGLDDADEVLAYLPPTVADSDGDGLYDHLDSDMDGDGIPNVDECRFGGVSGLALENGSFELPHYSGVAAQYPSSIPGWRTTDTAFEVWTNNFLGVPAYEGTQLVELNAFAVGTLYQDISTTYGDVYIYAFSHRGRAGSDTMRFLLSGIPVRTATDGLAWGRYGGVITIVDAVTSFQFQSVSSACGMSCGNLLDDISFTPACDLDTDGDSTPDALDTDSDGDGVLDNLDVCPGEDDATVDPDGDLLCGAADPCPLDPLNDSDGDGACGDVDVCAGANDYADMDSDGQPDACDACPLDPLDDSDGDITCDSLDLCAGSDDREDADGDVVADGCDPCPDVPYESERDLDADGTFDECDLDGDDDGVPVGEDCDDLDLSIGAVTLWFLDYDRDGFGDSMTPALACEQPPSYVAVAGDCEDALSDTFPGAVEICTDETDKNCDGVVSFDDPDYDGACGAFDPCPLVYGFVCDTGDTGADTAADTGTSDTSDTDTSIDTAITEDTATDTAAPEECDTAPTVVLVDEEDPELYRGGWRCGVVGGSPSGIYLVLGSMLAALWSRRASRR